MVGRRIKWLASYPKSGNTWVRCFLRAYQLDAYEPIDLSLVGRISKSDSRYADYAKLQPDASAALTDRRVNELREQVTNGIAEQLGDFQVVKTHNARVAVDGIPLIRNEMTDRAVYVVRNPLDVVDSLADHTGSTVDEAIRSMNDQFFSFGGADRKFVRQYLTTWSNHVRSWTQGVPFPVLIVKYEDLIDNPQHHFALLLHFLGWPVVPERLERAIKFSSFNVLSTTENTNGFRELSEASSSQTFFRRGQAGAWADLLSSSQVASLRADHGSVMEQLGYLNLPVATHP